MRPSTLRLVSAAFVFVAALAGALLLMRTADDGSSRSSGSSAAASEIWKVGDTWTVNVGQDAGAITPDGDTNVARIPFHFKVTDAPKGASGTWKVKVTQEGAEGPFAAGWRLHYAEQGDALVLKQVAMGTDKPLEAEVAAIVLGSQFPYEVRYTKAPKDHAVAASDLIERSSLPPSSAVPGSDAASDEGAPKAPPLSEAVAPPSAPSVPRS